MLPLVIKYHRWDLQEVDLIIGLIILAIGKSAPIVVLRQLLTIGLETIPNTGEIARLMTNYVIPCEEIGMMLASCEGTFERICMALALRENNLPTLEIEPQRLSRHSCNRSSLPGPGQHCSASAVRLVGSTIDTLNPEMAHDTNIRFEWSIHLSCIIDDCII